MLSKPLDADPGTRNAYSNVGCNLLGRVFEKLAGQTFDDVARTRLRVNTLPGDFSGLFGDATGLTSATATIQS
jgi:hypothetical protein